MMFKLRLRSGTCGLGLAVSLIRMGLVIDVRCNAVMNRNRNLQTSKGPLRSQAQGTSLFASAWSNQRGCPTISPWKAYVRLPEGERRQNCLSTPLILILLHCIVLHCIALYCMVLHCIEVPCCRLRHGSLPSP